jgi:uncharacterized protein
VRTARSRRHGRQTGRVVHEERERVSTFQRSDGQWATYVSPPGELFRRAVLHYVRCRCIADVDLPHSRGPIILVFSSLCTEEHRARPFRGVRACLGDQRMDFFAAAINGDLEMMRIALKLAPELLHKAGPGGWPALHLAAHFGQEAAVALLLELGALLEQRSENSNNNTPLHAAVAGCRWGTTQLLLERGADIRANYGGTCVLHEAAFKGDPELIRLLLRWKADPNAVNAEGETPLAIATKHHGTGEAGALLAAAQQEGPEKAGAR